MAEILTEEVLREMKTAVDGIRAKADEFGTKSATFLAYQEKAEKELDKLEKANAENVKKWSEELKLKEELKDRIQHLESLAGNSNSAPVDDIKAAHAVMSAMAKGKSNIQELANNNPAVLDRYVAYVKASQMEGVPDLPIEASSFIKNVKMNTKDTTGISRTDIGEFGGFLCPPEWSNELLKQIIEASPIRKYARVKQIGGKTLMQPIRQGVPTALWAGETESGSTSVSNYVMEEITPYRLNNTVPVTWDMINDSKYNISEEIMVDSAIAFGQAEGLAAVKGSGVKRSLGFTVDSNVPVYTSAASTLTFDDIIGITGALKQGYNPMYAFNRRTMAFLRTLKDTANRYLWSGPFGDAGSGAAATINGFRYSSEFIDMDDVTVATGIPIIFADMMKFYQITDRTDMILIRDEYTQKKLGIIEFTMMRWTTGQAVMKEAGILLQKHS